MKQVKLKGEVVEVLNRYVSLPLFLESGFIPYVPEFDVGIDFILVKEKKEGSKESGDLMLKVQAKGRLYVSKRYFGRDIWILFPDHPHGEGKVSIDRNWYFCPHDLLVKNMKPFHHKGKDWIRGEYGQRSFKVSSANRKFLSDFELSKVVKSLSLDFVNDVRTNFEREWH